MQLQSTYQAKAKELQDIAAFMQGVKQEMMSLNANRQTFVSQLSENAMAKEELELLGDDAPVWKLIGPALVRQDKAEALDTINKRLDFIRSTVERVEKDLADRKSQVDAKNAQAAAIQKDLQAIQMRFQQMQQQAQSQKPE